MGPTDSPALKRTASSLEEAGEAVSFSRHNAKKSRKNDNDTEIEHTEDCEDPECEGCAEGEIILHFDIKPTAMEVFKMARDEVAAVEAGSTLGSSGTRSLSRLAKALFDRAIDEFEILEKTQTHIELNDETDVARQVLVTKIQHATCVVLMGRYIPSMEVLEDGTRMFDELAKKTAYQNGHILVGLGIAQLSQAGEIRRQALKTLELEEDELTEEQIETAGHIGKTEMNLIDNALENFDKGLSLLKKRKEDPPESESTFAQESIRAAQELDEYGNTLDAKLNQELACKTFDRALELLEDAQKHKADAVDSSADALSLFGSILYNKAKAADNQAEGDENPAKGLLERAIEMLVKAENMQGEDGDAKTLETLGQAYLMSTGLIEDEDMILERVEAAKEKLSHALALDPHNPNLRQQVEALCGGDDNFEYEDDDVETEEDGNDEDNAEEEDE
ncbi:hypothetical protein BX616_003746 [Lobosporangium transversale]|uniref:Uncharacterized protein n=1 Tax=Lobosporangium transversale TaxID=64571 RepID=A0A1Y2GKW7_9FUNG|nr:hypothetical protein BCR41DRAFT_386847 [Lobosporangium transversale]KAF9918955.1 hypothetical protein BX616_003746 [Lobosporangium transversale]ORZ14262.1 hypothetical protein BCR41DRAFT_386847 [Lobosporangium transversale]|eukprot:XP_021880740.1 hypothetical protein BCR41DRAFT_386847 [Lobosporangium transversale]